MKRLIVLLCTVIFAISFLLIGVSCKEAEPSVITETVVETVIETVEVEKEMEALPTLEELMEMGQTKNYDKPYLEGLKIVYADIGGGVPFTDAVTDSIYENFLLAGGSEDNWMYMDNQFDPDVALKNIDILIAEKPDGIMWFQLHSDINMVYKEKMDLAGITNIVNVELDVPGISSIAINNFEASYQGGQLAADIIEDIGGFEVVDLIIGGQQKGSGELGFQRIEGHIVALSERFGFDITDPIVKREVFGTGLAEEATEAMANLLAANPDAEVIVFNTINDESMAGAIAAIEAAGKDDWEKIVNISYGCDDVGKQLVRDGKVDSSIGWFPETYGEYEVPLLIAKILGVPIPHSYYMQTEPVTLDNIDEYYPE